MEKVRWGIIGCGDVTEVKSGPAFQKIKNSELVAVMRRNGDLARDYAERHKVTKWYDDADKLINDPEVNAVYVATPPSSHMKYTIAVSEAGKPVYVEKPMAINYAECEIMIEACKKASVKLFAAYYRRALPLFLKVKSLLDEKTIGKILSVNIRYYSTPSEKDKDESNWRVKPETAGCGYFCDLASHTFDLLQHHLGTITSVEGYFLNQMKNYVAEDIVSSTFKFENGILGAGIWCFNADENMDQTEIIGTEGKIVYSTFNSNRIVLSRKSKTETFEIKHPEHVQLPLIQTIVNELTGKGKCPSTGETGAKTNWIMDRILGRF